jgi:hypothetical protein
MTRDGYNGTSFSNDDTKKILGFEYQKLIALECCLNSNPEDIIYIECYGDVSTRDVIIETKNHLEEFNMTDQSPDFWKTLRNFVKERNITTQYSKLVLHTSAIVKEKSIFSNWNEKSCEEKLRSIEQSKENPNESIKKFSDFIFNFNDLYKQNDLLEILEKLELQVSQPNVIEKYDELKGHKAFLIVDERYRDTLLKQLIGDITKKAIDDKNQWKIVCSDFFLDLRSYAKRFLSEEIPFPEVAIDVTVTGDEGFMFIKELKDIELEDKVVEAVIEYLMSEESSLQLIKLGGPSTGIAIDHFENELHGKMNATKALHLLDLSMPKILKSKTITHSKKLFFTCKAFEKLSIKGVQSIEMCYQHGKMHKIVEERNFVWRFLEKDIS